MRLLALIVPPLLLSASVAPATTIMVTPPGDEQAVHQPPHEGAIDPLDWEAEMDAEDKAWAIACPEGQAAINAMEAAYKQEQSEMTLEEQIAAAVADMEAAADDAMAMMDNCPDDADECGALIASEPFCPEAAQ
ncbi:hypothetical protein [Parasphingopyxis lamellibrachiae]|uniref:UrcA family protein n=1 Tax=Parasphingopyxis lamellibrachiae TaxID=680125 RepID=A0A3D9FGA3_9SPHN|nr:hypothetical protein [Parasphingopyxis lamellibrachiae]RED16803.1 hypothetical protein DFR46_1834 [Parasphingopyxis lamellibrachiae]